MRGGDEISPAGWCCLVAGCFFFPFNLLGLCMCERRLTGARLAHLLLSDARERGLACVPVVKRAEGGAGVDRARPGPVLVGVCWVLLGFGLPVREEDVVLRR